MKKEKEPGPSSNKKKKAKRGGSRRREACGGLNRGEKVAKGDLELIMGAG